MAFSRCETYDAFSKCRRAVAPMIEQSLVFEQQSAGRCVQSITNTCRRTRPGPRRTGRLSPGLRASVEQSCEVLIGPTPNATGLPLEE